MRTWTRRREDLAYGRWFLADGVTVAFNRVYVPLAEGSSTSGWSAVAGRQWYESISGSSYFYNDGHSEAEKQRLSRQNMERLGLSVPLLCAMTAHLDRRSCAPWSTAK